MVLVVAEQIVTLCFSVSVEPTWMHQPADALGKHL